VSIIQAITIKMHKTRTFNMTTRSFQNLLSTVTSWWLLATIVTIHSPCHAGLADKWKIDAPIFDYHDLQFEMVYAVSASIDASQLSYNLYDGTECKEGSRDITINSYLTGEMMAMVAPTSTASVNGSNDGNQATTQRVRLAFTVHPEAIAASDIYSVNDSTSTGTISVCVRFSAFTADPHQASNALEVNFLETIIAIRVVLDSGFRIDTLDSDQKVA
jgi:hypothetical protein